MAQAGSALSRKQSWEEALAEALEETAAVRPVHLAVLFASAFHEPHFGDLVARAYRETGADVLIGCSGQGIIGGQEEVEAQPALALLALSLPGATFRPVRLTQQDLTAERTSGARRLNLGTEPQAMRGLLVFADPFTIDCDGLVAALDESYKNVPKIGGLASGDHRAHRTWVFLNERAYPEGAVAVALGGAISLQTVVSQGCQPIGEPWMVTAADGNIIRSISGKPAYQVLVETVRALPPDLRQRARTNLLIGLAIDEYKESFTRGDFPIRNLMGVDPQSGAIAVGAYPRLGQTVQFQLRDAGAADEDLRSLLTSAAANLGEQRPAAALLCSCNGRGVGLFGQPHHDARGVARELGPLPLAGFFCNGEIGPIGGKTFLHGFTASIALLVPEEG